MFAELALPAFIDTEKPMQNGKCRSCGVAILWATTKKGKAHPLNEDGSSHFGTCPQAQNWSRK